MRNCLILSIVLLAAMAGSTSALEIVCNYTEDDLNQTRWTCVPDDLINATINDTSYTYNVTEYLEDPTNYALFKPVDLVPSAWWTNMHNPQAVTDGNGYTYSSTHCQGNVSVDLGAVMEVRSTEHTVWRRYHYTNNYIQYIKAWWASVDGSNWTRVGDNTRIVHFAPDELQARYLKSQTAYGNMYSQCIAREIAIYTYEKNVYEVTEGTRNLVYESIDYYGELRKNLKVSNTNIAREKFAWGDGQGAEYLTDGFGGRKWHHNKDFSMGNWYAMTYPTVMVDGSPMEGFPTPPPGSAVHIDLGNSTQVSRIQMYPHLGVAEYSFFGINTSGIDYYLAVSDDAVHWKWVAKGTFTDDGSKVTHNLPAGITGRFVRAELVPQERNGFYDVLGIEEIEVFEYVPNGKGGNGKDKGGELL